MNIEASEIREAVEIIKTAILQGQYEASKDVNRIQLTIYFSIGKYISNHTRKGGWGTNILESISEHLHKELPGLRGYSATNLRNMRLFYESWQMLDSNSSVMTDENSKNTNTKTKYIDNQLIVNSSVATDESTKIDVYHTLHIPATKDFPIDDFFRVPFTHHIEINKLNDISARYYYIRRTAEEHLSVDILKKLIKEDVYSHQTNIPSNFQQTIHSTVTMRKAVTMFKDSYFLDFINTEQIGERDMADVDERVIEQQIVQNIKNFIMTFGHDFAFIGNQYHLEVYGIEHFPDLLFFNRELNAMVVVELKTGEFKPSYLGQLMSYLSILDAKVKKSHENPTIGIVLCKSAKREYVEFVIRDYNKPMGVATYSTSADVPENLRKALPDIDDLKKILE